VLLDLDQDKAAQELTDASPAVVSVNESNYESSR
jgi:hypothetical protein